MNDGKICVSVCAKTTDELIGKIKSGSKFADMIEIRFDCLSEECVREVRRELKSIRRRFAKPIVITFRTEEEGGMRKLDFFGGRIRFWTDPEIVGQEFVDIEFDLFSDYEPSWKIWELAPTNFICSHHNFYNTSKKLEFVYEEMANATVEGNPGKRRKAEILKISTMVHEITHSLPHFKILKRAVSENRKVVSIAMGEAGKLTRILGLANGSPITYASLKSGKETAPGQISAKDLVDVYRVKELDTNTEIYGIIGNPVSHSLSPYIHNAAFKHHNLNAVYIPFEVSDLDEFIRRMVREETREISWNLNGFSVTIPHKQTIMKHLDLIDQAATKIGAVNTVQIIDGKLYGFNTDAKGFIEPLKTSYGPLANSNVCVIGNGGAARACIYALENENAKVSVFARNTEKASSLAKDFDVGIKPLKNIEREFQNADIVIDTTPLGSKGKLENQAIVSAIHLENVKFVYDLVYNPIKTALMKEADKANVSNIGGLPMLITQAVAQQKIWTGLNAPVEELDKIALKRIH